jgi:hypothetical protein
MVDVETLVERALNEGWSWALVAEQLLRLAPSLDPEQAVATLHRVARERAGLGPLEATRAAVRVVLADASRAA